MNNKKRQKILERDEYECQFCEMTNEAHEKEYGRGIEVHHVVPKKADGSDKKQNLLTVCRSCHATLEKTQGNLLKRLYKNQVEDEIDELEQKVERLEEDLEDKYSFDEIISGCKTMNGTVDVYIGEFKEYFKKGRKPFITSDKEKFVEQMEEYPIGEMKMSTIRVSLHDLVKEKESKIAESIERKKRLGKID